MTCEEWLRTTDAVAMLRSLYPMHGSGSMAEQPRLLRLYYCNLARLNWPNLSGPHRVTVESAERFVERGATDWRQTAPIADLAQRMIGRDGHPDDIDEWRAALSDLGYSPGDSDRKSVWSPREWRDVTTLVTYPFLSYVPNPSGFEKPGLIHRADLVRDAFPHSEIRSAFDPAWCTDSAVSLARSIDRNRDFSVLPLLADVLEESGCHHELILNHGRDPHAMHARGCWLVEFLLGRS